MNQFILQRDQLIDEMTYNCSLYITEEKFFLIMESLLVKYNCQFGYLRKDAFKNGHLKLKKNYFSNVYSLEIKINRNDNFAGQSYTLIHEFVHLYNNHLTKKELTKKQSEIVADTVAIIFMKKMNILWLLEISDVADKWDVMNYSNHYINNMACSPKRKERIFVQIINTVNYLQKEFEGTV